MKAFCVTACVSITQADGGLIHRQIPTFYLLACVQGIVDEDHAEIIAREIISGSAGIDIVYLTVMEVEL